MQNNVQRNRNQRGIKKGKFKPGDGPGVFVHGDHHQDLNSQESGSTGDPGDIIDVRQQQLEDYNKRHGIMQAQGARLTPKDGHREGRLIDNIYRESPHNGRNSRSNSLNLRPGEEHEKYQTPKVERQRTDLLRGLLAAE